MHTQEPRIRFMRLERWDPQLWELLVFHGGRNRVVLNVVIQVTPWREDWKWSRWLNVAKSNKRLQLNPGERWWRIRRHSLKWRQKDHLANGESESYSIVSDFLRPHGYSLCNSPGQNPGVGSLSLLLWIFPTQESNQGLLCCRGFSSNWANVDEYAELGTAELFTGHKGQCKGWLTAFPLMKLFGWCQFILCFTLICWGST